MAKADSAAPAQFLELDYHFDPLRLHAARPDRYPFLLESTASGTEQGRFDLLLAFPGERLSLHPDGQLSGPHADQAGFLAALDSWWRREPAATPIPGLVFSGGWFLLLGYELASEIEPSLQLQQPATGPVATAVRVPAAVLRDHHLQRAWLVSEPDHAELLPLMHADVAAATDVGLRSDTVLHSAVCEEPAQSFLDAVLQAKAHIAAGDIFQANLSRQWQAVQAEGVQACEIYARLRRSNPGPFAGLAVLDDLAVISSSPERLVAVRDGRVATRPIAGTRPRRAARGDEPTRAELLGDPKDRAEHVMLIDLERNDLGRICRAGSIAVDEFMVVESYSHVHHIVSNVFGRLATGCHTGEVIARLFPAAPLPVYPRCVV